MKKFKQRLAKEMAKENRSEETFNEMEKITPSPIIPVATDKTKRDINVRIVIESPELTELKAIRRLLEDMQKPRMKRSAARRK